MTYRLLLFTLALLTPSLVLRGQSVPADFAVSLERMSCFGTCPVYSVRVDATGRVTYVGRNHVRVSGQQTKQISSSDVAALAATVERIGFFELDDRYHILATDLPTTFVTVTSNGRTKRIEDYFGAPEALQAFEKQIDTIAGTRQWVER